MIFSKLFTSSLVSLACLSLATSHMLMTVPVPRQGTDNSPAKELCQGRHAGGSTTTLTAGSLIEVVISGGAPHGGGGCLFSLSYDGGHTFKVISSTDKSCPINHNYQVMIPQNAPSGNAVFAWSWVPVLSGQPEYYMNCADVTIVGGNGSGFNGPNLPIYNMPGSSTIYSSDPQRFIGLTDIVHV